MSSKSPKVDDSLNITINIRWLVQLVVLIGAMVGAWYNLKMNLNETITEVKDVQGRMQVLENARNEQLSEMNKTLWQKTFGKDE
jgi:uncharacterized membrane protein YqgA involved in biofilm formation